MMLSMINLTFFWTVYSNIAFRTTNTKCNRFTFPSSTARQSVSLIWTSPINILRKISQWINYSFWQSIIVWINKRESIIVSNTILESNTINKQLPVIQKNQWIHYLNVLITVYSWSYRFIISLFMVTNYNNLYYRCSSQDIYYIDLRTVSRSRRTLFVLIVWVYVTEGCLHWAIDEHIESANPQQFVHTLVCTDSCICK